MIDKIDFVAHWINFILGNAFVFVGAFGLAWYQHLAFLSMLLLGIWATLYESIRRELNK